MGSLQRQSASANNALNGKTAMFNAIRCMSGDSMPSSKLFIGGLSYGTNDLLLRDVFASFGDITDDEAAFSFGFLVVHSFPNCCGLWRYVYAEVVFVSVVQPRSLQTQITGGQGDSDLSTMLTQELLLKR